MYPKPWLTGAQGNLCCSPSCLWPPQHLALSLCSPPLPATGRWGWAAPLPQLSLQGSKGLFIFCCWLQWEMKWSLCTEGRMKDNIWAVHSVLTGEIAARSGTSLLTPPICIFSPLGNSGGQIKQVCFGLGRKKKKQKTPSHHFCVFKWKWHHPLTATLTCLCFTSHRNVGQSAKEKRTTSFWEGAWFVFSVLDVQNKKIKKKRKKLKKKKKKKKEEKRNRHSCNQVAGAIHPHCPGPAVSCPSSASALYHGQQNLAALHPGLEDPLQRTRVVWISDQWTNNHVALRCTFNLLLIYDTSSVFGKCSVAYPRKVIEVFVIRDLTTALCYYNCLQVE